MNQVDYLVFERPNMISGILSSVLRALFISICREFMLPFILNLSSKSDVEKADSTAF